MKCSEKCCFDCKAYGTRDCLISCPLETRCTSEELQTDATCKAFERKEEKKMTAIRITVTATAEDFKTTDRLIRKTLEDRTDTISESTGSSLIEVVEIDTANGRIIDAYNYSECAKGEVAI